MTREYILPSLSYALLKLASGPTLKLLAWRTMAQYSHGLRRCRWGVIKQVPFCLTGRRLRTLPSTSRMRHLLHRVNDCRSLIAHDL